MLSKMLTERQSRNREPPDRGETKQPTTSLGGDVVEVDTSDTVQTFAGANTLLTDTSHGWPRGAEVIAGRQLGQTPLMEMVKNVIADQITGGELAFPMDDENPPQAVEDLRDLVRDVLEGPHTGKMDFDDLVDALVSDIVDTGWAYWEPLSSEQGDVPVVQAKPVDALTIQHNLSEQGQFEEPAFYHAPVLSGRTGGYTPASLTSDPVELEWNDLVAFRGPHTAKPNNPYGTPPAVKARELLEIFVNSTADINRDYDDTQIPQGVFMTESGAVDTLRQKLRQSRGDGRKAPIMGAEVDWLDIGGVDNTKTRIAEQEWFLNLILGMHGINRHEIGITDDSGLGTETPAQARLIYKKVTLPYLKTINAAIRTQFLPLFDVYNDLGQPFGFEVQRVDPRQEVVEEKQALSNFDRGVASINEVRETIGSDPMDELTVEVGDTEIDLANTPKYVVKQLLAMERPQLSVEE